MNVLLRALSLSAVTFVGSLHAAPPADLGKQLVARYIQPATTQFAGTTAALDQALAAYCDTPTDKQLRTAVERRYGNTIDAWARVELLRFGPLLEDNRFERFFFFPDPRGVTLRQVQALLAAADPALLTPGNLRSRSVAVQGLPALEYALYGSDAAAQLSTDSTAGRYRCAYARAIAANLATLSSELQRAWAPNSPMAREFSAPAATQTLYRSRDEVATEAIKALSTALQYSRDIKLLPALGAAVDDARGQRAPLWRSGLTQRALAASTLAMHDFYAAGNFAPALSPDSRWIDDTLKSESEVALEDFKAVLLPFEQAVQDTDSRERLVHAALVLKNMQSIVVELLAPALGINIGFNALDGD
jgi:predicted lipoprotein